jgi:type IV pilus assembly protein PilV
MRRNYATFNGTRGFSLLEVLIAVIVLSIGILGVAGLQVFSLRANQVSYVRSQAAILASDISDRMRANRVAAANNNYALDPDAPPEVLEEDPCADVSCDGPAMAARDLALWFERVTTMLPGGTARIFCSDAPCLPASLHTISVMWDENRTDADDPSCPDPEDYDPDEHLACLTVSLQP